MTFTSILKKLFGGQDQPRPAAKSARAPEKATSAWHSVSILPSERACRAALDAVGARYLSKRAPALPLEGCDAPNCTCRYSHHDDRRCVARRAADIWSANNRFAGEDRRRTRGRRRSDHPEAFE